MSEGHLDQVTGAMWASEGAPSECEGYVGQYVSTIGVGV